MLDVAVVGAGLPGLMAAWRLASEGMKVAVFESRTVAAESSALAAGHVPQVAFDPATLAILRRTRELVETLDRRTGGVVRYHTVGGITLVRTAENVALLKERGEALSHWGVTTEIVSPGEAQSRWPQLVVDDLVAVYACPEDGFVRSLDLSVVLAAMARLAGGTIHEGCPVDRIDTAAGRVHGVILGSERVAAHRVVLTAGGWSRQLAQASGFDIPLRPFTLSAVTLADVPFALPFLDDPEQRFYAICRAPGALLLGLPPLVEGVTAESFSRESDALERGRYVDLLRHRVPALRDCPVGGGWAGLLTGTPDGFPLVGAWPGVEGLFLATGFGGGGLQRVAAAEGLAQEILGEQPFFDTANYRAARFSTYDGGDFAFNEGLPFYYSDAFSSPASLGAGE